MTNLRFKVGDAVMCNLGSSGWKLGKVIALGYREDHWPADKVAPYQVVIEDGHTLIYVPEDEPRYCREATDKDLRIIRRTDALAPPEGGENLDLETDQVTKLEAGGQLGCLDGSGIPQPGSTDYRRGRCHCCDCCPSNWTAVELYSEHYRCVARNGLKVTRHAIDLGTVQVGDSVRLSDDLPSDSGFMQAPTLVRLPPGVRFSDDGSLTGEIRFDPHRATTYNVAFVAVSTADWNKPDIGIVRLEITCTVEANEPPDGFDVDAFTQVQHEARAKAEQILRDLGSTWRRWEQGVLDNRQTIEQMCTELGKLRMLLEQHPRLDDGWWWAQLGGFHMNVHKLLENTLFECELYLGHALTFGNAQVRWMAEQNLNGCYQKRQLEAARFMWIDGLKQMMQEEWLTAAETLQQAAAKKDGWGWAVNFGDIWFTESAARLVHGAELSANHPAAGGKWIDEAAQLLKRGAIRTSEAEYFGPEGHPWAVEIGDALAEYRKLQDSGADITDWLKAFKLRTAYWCAQVLGGAPPFPPQPRPRREDAAALVKRLPGHNE